MRELTRTLRVHGLLAAYLLPLLLAAGASAQDAPAEGGERTRVIVLGLKSTGMDEDTVRLIDDVIAVELSRFDGLDVLSGADVRRMVELEAERQASGCDDDGSCLAEIADALGAKHAIYGRVGKLGSQIIMTLNLFDSSEARSVQRNDIRAKDLDELSGAIPGALTTLVAPVTGAVAEPPPSPPPVEEPAASGSGTGVLLYKLGMIGGGLAIAGVTLAFDATADTSQDGDIEAVDFAYLAGELAGVTIAIVGLATNPFSE
jgi:TolB-like protein